MHSLVRVLFSVAIATLALAAQADSASLMAQAQTANPIRYQFAVDNNAQIRATSDNKSFTLWWQPGAGTPSAVIVTLHGHDSFATDSFFMWQSYAQSRGYAVLALQWWFGAGETTADYYMPSEMYPLIANLLTEKGVQPGTVLLEGYSRGSANSYAVTALDTALGNRFIGMTLSNSGGAHLDYPPNQQIVAGDFGAKPFTGVQWIMYCGEQDPDPTGSGCPAMTAARDWVVQYGADFKLLIDDPGGDHGGFMTNGTNVNTALDQFTPTASRTLYLVPGWNLVGNSVNAPLQVATTLTDASKIASVWKWLPASSKWAFYTPLLTGQALSDYAASKNYDVLTTINAGEGFWVNANAAFSVLLPDASAVSAAMVQASLGTGWNLIAVGETRNPGDFDATSLWAWDANQSAWYFYAPSMNSSGELAAYGQSRGYFDFATTGKKLTQGVGFWVKAAAVSGTPVTIDLVSTLALSHPSLNDLLGVISGPTQPVDSPAPALTTQLKDIGVTSIRNNDYYDDRLDIEQIFNCGGSTYPSWEGCDANDDRNYNWSASDLLVQTIHDAGFDLMLRLGGEWENGSRSHDFKGPQNATQEANWIAAAIKVAQRYAGKYTYLDIWTEFPGTHFWDRSNVEFDAFYVKAYKAIHAALPTAKLGGPGFMAAVSRTLPEAMANNEAVRFVGTLYAAGVAPAWLGWHDFNNSPEGFRSENIAYRELLDGTGVFAGKPWSGTGFFAGTELLVDAYGSSATEDDGSTALSAAVLDAIHNGGRGAAQIVATWMNLQSTDAKRAYYYRFGDPESAPNTTGNASNRTGWYGLFYGDSVGTYKPSAYAVKLLSTVTKKYSTLKTIATPAQTKAEGIYVTTALSASGATAILVANNSANSYAWSPSDASILVGKTVMVSTVSDTLNGRTPVSHTGTAFQLSPWSVALVEIQ